MCCRITASTSWKTFRLHLAIILLPGASSQTQSREITAMPHHLISNTLLGLSTASLETEEDIKSERTVFHGWRAIATTTTNLSVTSHIRLFRSGARRDCKLHRETSMSYLCQTSPYATQTLWRPEFNSGNGLGCGPKFCAICFLHVNSELKFS